MPRSTYYYHLKQMQKPDKYAAVKENITAIYHENQGRYGYRRITMELHNRGYQANHKTVQRLMKTLHLKCMVRVKKYRSYKGGGSGNRKITKCIQRTTKYIQNVDSEKMDVKMGNIKDKRKENVY